ncbi:MAG TPA: alpha/beta hydrolase [Kineosporiaceae bacterium]|nr:alpha/beta hydrolase [Kineosporiaceae bacterium]
MARQQDVTLTTLDRLHLRGANVEPEEPAGHAVVLVHGGGVTREEGGFFSRLADGLAEAGVASLRFDLRGHGQSEGRVEELTLAAVLNDIRVAMAQVRELTGVERVSLLGASFGGGICAYYAAKRPDEVERLVLLNPQLDYKRRTVDNTPFWENDHLKPDAAAQLTEQGYLTFSPTLRHGRAIFHEVFWFDLDEAIPQITAPTLLVHGTKDTLVPIESTLRALPRFRAEHRLVKVEGAQHGFAVHDDPQYLNPQSQEWQAFVIRTVTEWVTAAPAD